MDRENKMIFWCGYCGTNIYVESANEQLQHLNDCEDEKVKERKGGKDEKEAER